jgi:AraC family transcriptional regulator
MSQIAPILAALDFVEENLQRDIAVADIAEAATYSLYHFCRTFNKLVHHTPYDYVMRRRLSESARELIETDKKIIDVALDYQFNHPETYSRAFKRMFGMQPTQWRNKGAKDPHQLMPRLTPAHIRHLNQGHDLGPVLERREALHLAGVMTLVQAQEKETAGAALWEILAQELATGASQATPQGYYGLTWYPKGWEKQGLLYLAAAAFPTLDPPISGTALMLKRLPGLTYARFMHPGQNLQLTLDYIYHTWLPKSSQCPRYPLEIEDWGATPPEPQGITAKRALYIPLAKTKRRPPPSANPRS